MEIPRSILTLVGSGLFTTFTIKTEHDVCTSALRHVPIDGIDATGIQLIVFTYCLQQLAVNGVM